MKLGHRCFVLGFGMVLLMAGCGPSASDTPGESFSKVGGAVIVRADPATAQGPWQGWGTSLAWWAQGVGGSAYEGLYADLFFSLGDVSFMGQTLPGLGLNIVRYNVGGGGRPGDYSLHENVPGDLAWFKDIDGYWLNWDSSDPSSPSWDWSRDAGQRSMLSAAIARGVDRVEAFSNAPMWWMTTSKSSAGGRLQTWNHVDFARYLATVAEHAEQSWGVRFDSIEPFNEPSAGWWNYPKNQEGANIPVRQQSDVLARLFDALRERRLATPLAASDENTMRQAKRSLEELDDADVQLEGQSRKAGEAIGQVNVHGYNGLDPWRDNGARAALRRAAGSRTLWMSEYGDGDGSGMTLAETIVEDLQYLKPSAWVYWQALEPYSAWGLVNGDYATSASMPDRGRPTWIYTKYYVMAQFTRFLRPGVVLLDSGDPETLLALDPAASRLIVINVNPGAEREVDVDLSAFPSHEATARMTVTRADGSALMARASVPVDATTMRLRFDAGAVSSVVLEGVR